MNRLGDQTSPYLLSHAGDPVEWQPWNEEALALARREDKPILLSIGYSANHLCHRMARESFNSSQVASIMNQQFVNIIVDREERPDIDRFYQVTHGLLNRKPGGWPLTLFIDPEDCLPFFGGTYFPPQPGAQTPGFREVLRNISKMYGEKNRRMAEFKEKFSAALGEILGGHGPAALDATLVERACGQIDASFDAANGGFSTAPKYPHPAGLDLLQDAAICATTPAQAERACYMLDFTLAAMSRGGLFDHVGGGFHRAATDATWTIPHFEKMLYDNGALLAIYAARAAATGSAWFAETAQRTADWLLSDMQLEGGAFGASLDADSDGGEGEFYLWRDDALRAILGDDQAAFAARFAIKGRANHAGRWQLRMDAPVADTAPDGTATPPPVASARQRLAQARAERPAPQRDDKILTAWNALVIHGLAAAGRLLGRNDHVDAAIRAADYLQAQHWRDGQLLAVSRDGKAHIAGFLDDYALLLDAQLALLGTRWRDTDLTFAIMLADVLITEFEDSARGGFYFSTAAHQSPVMRIKPYGDESLPSGNAVAVRALLELGRLLGESRYVETAERALAAGMTDAGRWPSAHATLMRALLDVEQPPARVIVRGTAPAAAAWLARARERLGPRARVYGIPHADALPGRLSTLRAADDAEVTAWVERGATVQDAVTSFDAFTAALDA
ncbi:MAG: thioredoxin domain-containing protein [Gammaproteobacteria bacterium]